MTTVSPVLAISDGSVSISLLDPTGILLNEWIPTLPEPKGGGVWADSPISEGRKLAYRQLGTVVDVLDLKIRGSSQDDAVYRLQELRRLLEKSISYWVDDSQNSPVYLIAKAAFETNTRYAVILDYRTPRDSNPFAQPFFSCKPLVDNFLLSIEHGLWQDNVPGNSECVEISAEQDFVGSPVTLTDAPTASADDCLVSLSSGGGTGIDLSSSFMLLGLWSNRYDIGIRFTAVNVPAGATIISAHINLVGISGANSSPLPAIIYGNDVDDAATFSTYGDYTGRSLTAASVNWNIPLLSGGLTYTTPDLSAIIQEIVDRVGWASGQDIAILIKNQLGFSEYWWRNFATYDSSLYTEPQLSVVYTTSTVSTYGRNATCDSGEVFIVNKHNTAGLTNILVYDDSVPSYTEVLGDALPYDFLPNAPGPEVDDIVYFGSALGPFNNLVFDIYPILRQVDGTVWEYYTGAAWATLTVQDNTDTTVAFDTEGINSVHWTQPSNWATVAVDGITNYWVRLRITSIILNPTAPTQRNRQIYTAVWPYVELQADQVAGDIPALARITIINQSDASGGSPDLRANRFIIGSRSLSKGENYTPYLNISDEQNPTGVTVALGANTVYSNNGSVTTGRLTTYTSPALAGTTTEATITLDEAISGEYLGRFRAFIRYAYQAGAVDAVSLRLVTTPGGSGLTQYSDYYYPQNNSFWQLADMGIVNIPPRSPSDSYGTITFAIEITRDTNGRVVYLHELILMPVDEWATDAVDKSGLAVRTGAVGYDDLLDIDSVTYPRQTDQAVMRTASTGRIIGYYQNRQTGAALLQANAAQRLWFLCISYESGTELSSLISVSHTIQVQRVQRYLSARGTR